MKHEIGQGQHKWEKGIIRDLDYIKTNKRYRRNATLTLPLIVYIVIFFLAACLSLPLIGGGFDSSIRNFGKIVLPAVSLLVLGLTISGYLKSLKFITLNTGCNKLQNYDLLMSFLKQKGLLVYHHPETNDVIQIVSRSLGFQDDRREVIVFVMDENAILINSHFTNEGWKLTAASRHDKQIAAELTDWMLQYKNHNERAVKYR